MDQKPIDAWKIDRVTAAEMAERMTCTRQSIQKAANKAGIEPGSDGRYDGQRLQKAIEEGREMDKNNPSPSLLSLRIKLLEEQSKKIRMENEREEKTLVRMADVEAAQARVHQAVVADILSACQSVAPRLEGLSVPAMAARLAEAMKDALRHIAEGPDEKPSAD